MGFDWSDNGRRLSTGNWADVTLAAFRLALPPTAAQECRSWRAILLAMEAIRGETFDWVPPVCVEPGHRDKALQAIGTCPSLIAWIESDVCMVSPKVWPNLLYPAFAHKMIPTPYELLSARMKGVKVKGLPRYYGILLMHLYAFGMSIDTISEILDCGESMVLQQLFLGAHNISRWPPFVVWSSATDFSRAILPTHISFDSQYEKHEFFRKVDKSPFAVSHKIVGKIVESPAYLSYLIYQSPKKPRISNSRVVPLTKEAR